jgi:23S rRNA (cytosine1962-C5)-methyltransferase
MELNQFLTPKQKDYELIDAGDGMKLERFGKYILSRPDPQALFEKTLDEKKWNLADAFFIRKGKFTEWKMKDNLPNSWNIEYGSLKLQIKPTSFKHVGLFPEQLSNWIWIEKKIKESKRKDLKVLNLFGYTGGASLTSLKCGAEVVNVDGSKATYIWARKNQELSNLKDAKVRWLIDDAISFLKKEVKRKNKYDIIMMDPPSFGHGPNGELWKIEENFLEIISLCEKVLSEDPLLFLINGYSSGFSPVTYKNNLLFLKDKFSGSFEYGELLTEVSSNPDKKLSSGFVVRWSR